jgi:hypothetical protein
MGDGGRVGGVQPPNAVVVDLDGDCPASLWRKPGRPRTTGKGLLIGMCWHAGDLDGLDAWARAHNIKRTEAIRQLVRLALAQEGKRGRSGGDHPVDRDRYQRLRPDVRRPLTLRTVSWRNVLCA